MLRFERNAKILKDRLDNDSGWLTVSIRSKELHKYLGQDMPVFVMVDTDRAHNPKQLVKMNVEREAPGIYKVNDHHVTFRLRYTCDCEFYQYSNGEIPCKHLIAVLKQLISAKNL